MRANKVERQNVRAEFKKAVQGSARVVAEGIPSVFAPHEIRITPVSSSSLFLFFLFLTLYSFRLSDTSASSDILHRFLYLFRREIAIFSFLFLLSFFISYATRKRVDRIVQSFVCPSNVCFCCMRGIWYGSTCVLRFIHHSYQHNQRAILYYCVIAHGMIR